jgi:hypothetical protein
LLHDAMLDYFSFEYMMTGSDRIISPLSSTLTSAHLGHCRGDILTSRLPTVFSTPQRNQGERRCAWPIHQLRVRLPIQKPGPLAGFMIGPQSLH